VARELRDAQQDDWERKASSGLSENASVAVATAANARPACNPDPAIESVVSEIPASRRRAGSCTRMSE